MFNRLYLNGELDFKDRIYFDNDEPTVNIYMPITGRVKSCSLPVKTADKKILLCNCLHGYASES